MAIGNGANDVPMLKEAVLSIYVIGGEGAVGESVRSANIVVVDIGAVLDLLLNPRKLTATLRR